MLDAQKLTIGIPTLDYGLVERLSIGPDLAARAAPAFTVKGRYHLYTGKLVFESSGMLDPYTTVGAATGTPFVPGTDAGYARQTFVPAASVSFAF